MGEARMATKADLAMHRPMPKAPAPLRHEGYRRLVAALPCIHCGLWNCSQAAHPNYGKAKGRKTDDRLCFPLCCVRPLVSGCHVRHDNYNLLPLERLQRTEVEWAIKTQATICAAGLWPKGLPPLDARAKVFYTTDGREAAAALVRDPLTNPSIGTQQSPPPLILRVHSHAGEAGEPMTPDLPVPLPAKKIEDIAFAVLRAFDDDRLWRALTYEHGPYDINTPTLALEHLAQAFYTEGARACMAPLQERADALQAELAQWKAGGKTGTIAAWKAKAARADALEEALSHFAAIDLKRADVPADFAWHVLKARSLINPTGGES